MQCSRQTDITWKVYNIHIHMFWRVREKLLCANWIWCCYALNLEAIRNDQPMIKKRLHASKHFYVILCLSTKLNRTTTTTSKYRKKNKSKRKATTTNKKKVYKLVDVVMSHASKPGDTMSAMSTVITNTHTLRYQYMWTSDICVWVNQWLSYWLLPQPMFCLFTLRTLLTIFYFSFSFSGVCWMWAQSLKSNPYKSQIHRTRILMPRIRLKQYIKTRQKKKTNT